MRTSTSTLAMRTTVGLLALFVIDASPASADRGDGAYQRVDRGMTFSLVAGATATSGGDTWRGGLAAELRARVLDAAGPVVALRWGPEASEYVFFGIELRPLFPALFLLDLSTGNEWFDLFVQSFGVELGAVWWPRDGAGVGLGVGLAIDVPLVLPQRGTFRGLALRLSARRVDGTSTFQSAPEVDRSEWTLIAALSLSLGVPLAFISSDEDPASIRR